MRVDVVAHDLGGARRLFGDRQVRGAGRRDDDRALAGRDVLLPQRDERARRRNTSRRARRRAPRRTSAASARVTSSVDPRRRFRRDGGDLGRRLAEAEHDLRETLTDGAVVIDAREAEILERLGAQRLEQPGVRASRRRSSPRATASRSVWSWAGFMA